MNLSQLDRIDPFIESGVIENPLLPRCGNVTGETVGTVWKSKGVR